MLVLPSLSEARPRTIIEAMFLGVPVVASTVGGVPGLVAADETGLLVPAGDPAALAGALGRLVRSPGLRERFGAAARARAAREFDPERTAMQYLRIYRSLSRARRAAEAAWRRREV